MRIAEVLLAVFVLLLLFGASRLPKLGRSLGESLREFKTGFKEGNSEPDKSPGDAKPKLPEGK